MKKILLTAGSSFSYERTVSEDDPGANADFPKWPKILSEKLNFELINKSKPGASNLYIYDHLMENIIQNQNNIGLVVAAWSYGFKTSIFRNYELNFINVEDQDMSDVSLNSTGELFRTKIVNNGLLVSAIEQTLRLMIYLQDTCDSKNIKCVHYPLLNIFKTGLDNPNHVDFLETIIQLDSYKIVSSFNNVIGWPCDNYLGGSTYRTAHPELIVSNKDRHPNQQGQNIIAHEIYDKYLKL